jgi:hypothetical protein
MNVNSRSSAFDLSRVLAPLWDAWCWRCRVPGHRSHSLTSAPGVVLMATQAMPLAQRANRTQPRAERSDALGIGCERNHAPQRGARVASSLCRPSHAIGATPYPNPSRAPLGRMAMLSPVPGASLRPAPGFALMAFQANASVHPLINFQANTSGHPATNNN